MVDAGYRRVCYYTSWSEFRLGVGKFTPSDIDASLYSHIIFAFAKIKSNKLKKYYQNDTELYSQVTSLKLQNTDLKVLLAVGWGTSGSKAFSKMVRFSSRIKTFAHSTKSYLRQYNFDGLDLNCEYLAVGTGSHPNQKEKFGELCMKLRQVFEQESVSSGRDRLLLTSAVSAVKTTIDAAYTATILAA
ncbi:acidic mammalian chitinase-like [Mizuhopecten yessoensis]|uniref:Acidic mammalian chitinase n=1 Tax=Mizuhopecten yessoensis TaxID=6573 RepID=A0A210PIA3_MIZYE|nr:acidic mammalian chitinase-like [Mizuhopecten yessoensis]OWF36224.1 Acidic mammalian chitinase [Mizuhopecten yessoensis]